MAEYVPPPFLSPPEDNEYRPLSVHLQIALKNGTSFTGGVVELETLAQRILVKREGEIEGWLADLRQQNAIANTGVMSQELLFDDMRVEYQRFQKIENLTITAFPSPPPQPGTKSPFAGTFDVKCPFQGYPAGKLETRGVYTWAGWNIIDDGSITDDDIPFSFVVPWTLQMGVTGVCNQPITGLQYFEVQVAKLPARVPDSFQRTLSGIDDGSYLDCAVTHISRIELTYLFPPHLNTWLTPAIGLIPKQLMPVGLTKNTILDDQILVGMDTDDTILEARSVHITPTVVQQDTAETKNWASPLYELVNTSTFTTTQLDTINGEIPLIPFPAFDPHVLIADALIGDFNPILYANDPVKPTITVSENSIAPPPPRQLGPTRQDQNCVGVGGKYVIMPRGLIKKMPLNAITTADVDAAIAVADDEFLLLPPFINWTHYQGISLVLPTAAYGTAVWSLGATNVVNTSAGEFGYNDVDFALGDEYVDQLAGVLKYAPGKFVTTDYPNGHLSGDYLEGPGSNYSANSGVVSLIPFGDDQINYFYEQGTITPPQGVNALGQHTWAFKGRGDLLDDGITAADDGPLVPSRGGDGKFFNGVWSGTNLGTLKENDIIMIATDAGGRKVWFGKNGKWYDKHGVNDAQPGSDKLLPSLLLDGDGKQDYYPAASLRVGASEVKFLFGSSTKYPAPGGFKLYGNPLP